jgi:hypothetical protein
VKNLDPFFAPIDLLQETEIMFNTDWEGNIASLSCSMEPNVKDIVFTRQPNRRMLERSFLEPIAGIYQVADSKYVIAVRADNALTFTLPTRKVWKLEPVRGNTFAVKGVNGMMLDFKWDAAGKVTEFSLSKAGSSEICKNHSEPVLPLPETP